MYVFYAFILRMHLGFLSVKLRGEVAESLSQLCPKCSKMASENHQKSKKMWPRPDPGRANGIRDRLWAGGWYKLCLRKTSPDSPGHDLGWPRAPFGNRFRYKNRKNASKTTSNKWGRKTMEKRCLKVTKMVTKWMAKSLIFHLVEEKAKTLKTICFTI